MIVVGWYMHLRYEKKILSRFFTAGFVLAISLYTIILTALGLAGHPRHLMPLPPFHPHVDLYLLVFVLGFGYWYADSRLRPLVAPDAPPATTGQRWQWYVALGLLALVSGWPVHDIGETSLFTLHMIEHMVDRPGGARRCCCGARLAGWPTSLWGTGLWPGSCAPRPSRSPPSSSSTPPSSSSTGPTWSGWMLTSRPIHFAVHAWLFAAAILMWLPIFSPTNAIPRLQPPVQMLYLFLMSLLPTVPASFLTFSSVPIYPVYGDAALAYGLSAVADQTIAGIIMKVGGGFLIWGHHRRDLVQMDLTGAGVGAARSVAAVVIALALTACSQTSGTARGVVVAVDGDLEQVASFTVLVDGDEWLLMPVPDGDYSFALPHLREHQRTGEPVLVGWELVDNVRYALSLADG